MKKLPFLFLFLLFASLCFSQDVITLHNGEDISANVLEITDSDIVYKKHENPDGPKYTMTKDNIFRIKYKNGSIDVFDKGVEKNGAESAKDEVTEKAEGKATLVVYRGRQHYASMLNYWVIVDGQKTCKLSNNKFVTIEVPAGTIQVAAKRSGVEVFKKEEMFSLEVAPDQIYFVQGNIKRGIVNRRMELAEVTKNTADRDMVKMKEDRCQMKVN
jgi:hypothetical protein